jgi:hypothetical protein
MLGNTKSMSNPFSRVEEERSLFVKFDGDRVAQVELNMPEPSRLFASYLVGKEPREAPSAEEPIF